MPRRARRPPDVVRQQRVGPDHLRRRRDDPLHVRRDLGRVHHLPAQPRAVDQPPQILRILRVAHRQLRLLRRIRAAQPQRPPRVRPLQDRPHAEQRVHPPRRVRQPPHLLRVPNRRHRQLHVVELIRPRRRIPDAHLRHHRRIVLHPLDRKRLHPRPEMIDQVLPHARQHVHRLDPERRQLLRRPDPRPQQNRRRHRRPRRQHHPLRPHLLAVRQYHAPRRAVLHDHPIHQCLRPHRQVRPIPDPQQIRDVRRNPVAFRPVPRPCPHARRIGQIMITHFREPRRHARIMERPLQRLPFPLARTLDRHRPRRPVEIPALRIRLQPPIKRQHLLEPPALAARRRPRLEILRHPPQRDRPVHRRRPADHLPPMQPHLPPRPRIRREPPVMIPPRNPRLQQIPRHLPNRRIVRPRLHQQHRPRRIPRQPRRHHSPARPRPHDNHIEHHGQQDTANRAVPARPAPAGPPIQRPPKPSLATAARESQWSEPPEDSPARSRHPNSRLKPFRSP